MHFMESDCRTMKFTNNDKAQIDFDLKVPYISFPVLSKIPFIKHGFSTRLGGVSEGFYTSMNLGSPKLEVRDKPENIKENFERIARSIGVEPESIVVSDQVHKTTVRLVNRSDRGKGLYRDRDYKEVDGLITNQAGVTLVTKYADCVPLFFVDPLMKAIGSSHAGWKGTVGKIGHITVNEMNKHFQSNPKDIIAVIGPSICQDCYEVGEEVITQFKDAFDDKWHDDIITRNSKGRYQLDLWQANKIVLLEAGLKPEKIHLSSVCTSCNSDLLFSYRKSKGKRGSLAGFLAIEE